MNPSTPQFRPLRNSPTPTPAEASVRTSFVGSAMIHPGLALYLPRVEFFWDLPASARIVSHHACGHGRRVGDIELAVYAYCLPLDTTRSASQRADSGARYTAWSFPCERFDEWVAPHNASLGAKAIGEILPCTKFAFSRIFRLMLAHCVLMVEGKRLKKSRDQKGQGVLPVAIMLERFESNLKGSVEIFSHWKP